MKLKNFAPIAVLAVAGLWGSQASAVEVCTFCSYNGDTYLGSHDPTTNDFSTFRNIEPAAAGNNFEDTWLFSINPAGEATLNANFNPTENISNFLVSLYTATATCGAAGASCTGVVTGALIATGVGGTASSNIDWTSLAAGMYAFVITGNVGATPVQYTGQLNTRARQVPEPASLALLGLGLLGVGLARRRRA